MLVAKDGSKELLWKAATPLSDQSNSPASIERITPPNKETVSIRNEIKGFDFLLYMLDNQGRVFR